VLDAQTSRYVVQQQTETARLAKLYAQYQVLAAENRLIQCLGVQAPAAAQPTMMARYHVNPIPPADLQENSIPSPAMGPGAAPMAPGEPAPAMVPGEPAPPPEPTGR
jgi:adhesin transport system outer membrane protein